MADQEPSRSLLKIIQDYAIEKSQGGRILSIHCWKSTERYGLQGTCQPKEEEVTDHKNFKDLSLEVNACGERVALIPHKISEKTGENEELQRIHKEITQVHTELQTKLALMEAVLQESKELQVLSKQTTELEELCTSFSDQLQKSHFCPKCGVDNV